MITASFARRWLQIVLLGLLITACADAPTAVPGVAVGGDPKPTGTSALPPVRRPTLVDIPTVYPTETPAATSSAVPTPSPADTRAPDTPIAFDQVVVEFRYTIPALGLDRRLEGTVASNIDVVDESDGRRLTRRNQAGVLLELQGALTALTLPELPADCPRCVQFSYRLPASDLAGSGWLTDTVMLASVENFTSAVLGPHLPPDSDISLRRSAAAYHPAHTVALTTDGRLYAWQATDAVVPEPVDDWPADALRAAVAALPAEGLADSYAANCDGGSVETLRFRATADAPARTVTLACPQLTLPAMLLPVYTPLSDYLAATFGQSWLEQPVPAPPLAARIDYLRADGGRMVLEADGRLRRVTPAGEQGIEALDVAAVDALVEALVASDLLLDGAQVYATGAAPNIVLVRAADGVYEVAWRETPGELADTVAVLDALLDTGALPATDETATPPPGAPATATPEAAETAAAATPTP